MSRLNLIIADKDEDYIEGLASFLMRSHSRRFRISSFTSLSSLHTFLSESDRKIDILLAGEDFIIEPLPAHKVETVILLSEGEANEGLTDLPQINRYQHGDRLAGGIIKIYSDTVKNGNIKIYGGTKTSTIAVCSACGGTGKTSVAVCAAVQFANSGLSVFYLNLENIQSTSLYFDCSTNRNLSHVLYNLKGSDRNSYLKIEGISAIDTESKVWFFAPPENSAELEGLLPAELTGLIGQLKAAGKYDILLIDMPSSIDSRNVSVLESCDDIFLIITQDETCKARTTKMVEELDMLLQNRACILDKTTVIVNKFRSDRTFSMGDFGMASREAAIKLPVDDCLSETRGTAHFIDINNSFGAGVNRLINQYRIKGAAYEA